MQVSAISSSTQSFSGRNHKRDNIDREIFRSDNELWVQAYSQSVAKNRKRQHRVNGLFNSVPIIAALSAGILTKDKAHLFGKEVSGFAAKAVNGLKTGGSWAFLLGSGIAILSGINLLTDKSKRLKEFRQNHPLLTFGAKIGTLIAALSYLPKSASKLYNMIKPEVIAKAGKSVGELAEHVNKYVKAPGFMQRWGKAISSHTPELVKDAATAAAVWAPDIALVTAGLGAVTGYTNTVADVNKTYIGLKDRQNRLAQARINELKTEQC